MGMRVLGLMSGSLIQGSGARKTTLCQPRAFDFEGQQGLISGATQKWEKGDFILKGHTQNSLCPGTQGKSDDLRGGRVRAAGLGKPPGEAGVSGSSRWEHRHWWQTRLATRTLLLAVPP